MYIFYKIRPQNVRKMLKARKYTTTKAIQDVIIEKIRNIGIMAHIDAGKTTTTERMLFYTGLIKQMGEVHHGNTVTDYMSQERERGITITSAAVSFYWKNHQFNLIDTPGHIDFTMEVEQTLNVLDGGILVLDGSAGVEAQTFTVWRQADRYKIPRIVFVNKMDRGDSSLEMSCDSVRHKLEKTPLCLQIPLLEQGKLTGLVDVLTLEKLRYEGHKFEKTQLSEANDPKMWEKAKLARNALIDKLSEFNDELANKIIASDSLDTIKTTDITKAVKDVTLKQEAVPVFLGSAYKNIGIQPLMDAVILYLPSPMEKYTHFKCFGDNLCAKSFKVIHNKQKGGPLVFFRIYNGVFNRGQKIYSLNQDKSEQSGKLYVAFADDFEEVEKVENGNIAVVAGLKTIQSGDLITTTSTAAQKAKKNLKNPELLDLTSKIPEPVFFCSIEPPSLAYQTALETALTELQREDPSLRVSHNAETGQTVLGGMGELHIDIIKDRILKEYKVNAEIGPLQIAYREAVLKDIKDTLEISTKIGNSKQSLTVTLSLLPVNDTFKDNLRLDKTPDAASNIAAIFPKHLVALRQGIDVALEQGPKINAKVINAQVMLHFLEVGRGTSETMIAAATTQLVQKLIKSSGTNILEPIMHLEIVTPEEYLSSIMADLSRRRAIIENVTIRAKNKVLTSKTPLSELLGYSTILRTISSGTATFAMEFSSYEAMSQTEEEKAIHQVRGF